MAKLRGPLLSGSATGTIGGTIGYLTTSQTHIARSIATIRAAARDGIKRTPSAQQIITRDRWRAAVTAWNALTPQQRTEYANQAAPLALTGFNLYTRLYNPEPPNLPSLVQERAISAIANLTTLPVAFTSAVTAGHKLIAAINHESTRSITTVTDTQGNTWTRIAGPMEHGGQTTSIWGADASATGTLTATATLNGASYYNWGYVAEHADRAAGNTGILTKLATQTSPGTAPNALTSGLLANIPARATLIGITLRSDNYNANTIAAGTDWTIGATISTAHQIGAAESRIIPAAGSYAATFTTSSQYGTYTTAIIALPHA